MEGTELPFLRRPNYLDVVVLRTPLTLSLRSNEWMEECAILNMYSVLESGAKPAPPRGHLIESAALSRTACLPSDGLISWLVVTLMATPSHKNVVDFFFAVEIESFLRIAFLLQ